MTTAKKGATTKWKRTRKKKTTMHRHNADDSKSFISLWVIWMRCRSMPLCGGHAISHAMHTESVHLFRFVCRNDGAALPCACAKQIQQNCEKTTSTAGEMLSFDSAMSSFTHSSHMDAHSTYVYTEIALKNTSNGKYGSIITRMMMITIITIITGGTERWTKRW